jgi:hypothetical protein
MISFIIQRKKKIHKYFVYSFLVISIWLVSLSFCHAQKLNADSLMNKVEDFGKSILFKDQDTTYITNYNNNFTLKFIGINKINYFKVLDRNINSSLRYRPDRRLNLGAGISYKWFAVDLAFNVGIDENSDFQNSNLFDFQGSIFNDRQYISVSYQYYFGYQINNYTGIAPVDYPETNLRGDIRTVSLGLSYTFAFNYDKFSLKASFIQNEIQRKSAGSFLIGAAFNMFNVVADSSIVPIEVQNNFNQNLFLRDLNSTSLAVNFGYMYTFVWKEHFYITASLIPGIGLNMGDYQNDTRQPYHTHAFLAFGTMNTIGYNSRKLFGGIMFVSDAYNTRIEKEQIIVNGHGKIRLFLGMRFWGKDK